MKTILIFLVFVTYNTNAQYIVEEYPISFYYIHNNTFNLKLSFNRNTDFEGADFLYWEIPSLNFAVLQNPLNDSEMMYSFNPMLWLLVSSYNLISQSEPYTNIPHFLYGFSEQFLNLKISVPIYAGSSLILGLDHDYLFSKKYLALRGEVYFGAKYQIKHFSIKLLYNYQSIIYSTRYDDYNKDSIRLDISYIPDNNSITHFIYYCGSKE